MAAARSKSDAPEIRGLDPESDATRQGLRTRFRVSFLAIDALPFSVLMTSCPGAM